MRSVSARTTGPSASCVVIFDPARTIASAGPPRRSRDGWEIAIRPIVPGDESAWVAFVQRLSPGTRYKRGGTRLEDLTPALARRRVSPDPARELVLVAAASRTGESRLVGVARCERHDDGMWEFMLVVADDWQRRGIGRRLMEALDAEMARRAVARLEGVVLASNRGMLEFVQRLGFRSETSISGAMFKRVVKQYVPQEG